MLLCYYQGLTNVEAAERLGVPHGTVCGRLSRARELLRRRLIRRGVTLTIGMLTVGAIAPPGELAAATLSAAARIGAGTTSIIAIAEAVMNAMWTEKIRACAIGLVAAVAIGGGVGAWGFVPVAGQGQQAAIGVIAARDLPAPEHMKPTNIDEIEKAGQAIANGRIDDARKLLTEATARHPDLPPAWMTLIRLYKATHPKLANDKVYRSILEDAVRDSRSHPSAVLELASLAVLEGRNTEALIICTYAENFVRSVKAWAPEEKNGYITQSRYIMADAYQARSDWLGTVARSIAFWECRRTTGKRGNEPRARTSRLAGLTKPM